MLDECPNFCHGYGFSTLLHMESRKYCTPTENQCRKKTTTSKKTHQRNQWSRSVSATVVRPQLKITSCDHFLRYAYIIHNIQTLCTIHAIHCIVAPLTLASNVSRLYSAHDYIVFFFFFAQLLVIWLQFDYIHHPKAIGARLGIRSPRWILYTKRIGKKNCGRLRIKADFSGIVYYTFPFFLTFTSFGRSGSLTLALFLALARFCFIGLFRSDSMLLACSPSWASDFMFNLRALGRNRIITKCIVECILLFS